MSNEPKSESERTIHPETIERVISMRAELVKALPDDAQVDVVLAGLLVNMSITRLSPPAQGVQRISASPQQLRNMGIIQG